MKRKKILYVGNALSASGKTLTHIETLSADLRLEGYEVIVTSKKIAKSYRMMDMIATFFRSKKAIDLVLIDTYSTTNFWYAVVIAKLCRTYSISYISILHGGNLPARLKSHPKTCNTLFNNAKINIAPSGYLYDAFAKAKYENLTLIPNTIQLDKYIFKERKTLAPKLLWVRSFAQIYNPKMAVEVLSLLIKEYPEAQLTMIGPDKDGSLESCKEYAVSHNLPVTFTGKLSKEEWIKLSQETDIFINTTNFDNTPVSVIEAMALGLPIVSTNVGGMPFLIENKKDGILIEPDKPEIFTAEILKLLKNPEDTYHMTLKARDKVTTFDWTVIKELWNKVLS